MKNKGFCLSILILVLCMCASQGMPPGGPRDKSPPVLVQTIPETGSIQVPLDTKVSFYFDEAINPQKANDAIFITPFQGDHVKYRWRGKRLDILFDHPLKENRTYVITLGTGLRDYQSNAIDTSQTLAFSTGDRLDIGEIKGRIFGLKNAKGVDVWAYLIQDTVIVDPKINEPDYMVQCSENGSFHFKYLAPGAYRIFGIKDRIADRFYQPMEDEIGIASFDIILNDSLSFEVDSVYFQMTSEDTLRPSLLQSTAQHQEMVVLRFNEAVAPCNNKTIQFVDQENPDTKLLIKDCIPNLKSPNTVFCSTEKQTEGKKYQVIIDSLLDKSGNPFDTTFQVNKFIGAGFGDTLSPKLMDIIPSAGEQMVPLDQVIKFIFNEDLDTASVDTAFVVSDTCGNVVAGKFNWQYHSCIHFIPDKPLASYKDYWIKVLPNAGFDCYHNLIPDTLVAFKTLKKDTLSEVHGTLIDDKANQSGPYQFKLFQTDHPEITYKIYLDSVGVYQFKDILPGMYFIDVLEDIDLNKIYTPGNSYPWKPSERFIQMTDTIKVRSRWINEGNDIQMPN